MSHYLSLRHFAFLFAATSLPFAAVAQDAPLEVSDTLSAEHERSGLRILRGTVQVPAEGSWVIDRPFTEQDGLIEFYTSHDDDFEALDGGERMATLMDRRVIDQRGRDLRSLHYDCSEYARKHGGMGPPSVDALIPDFREKPAPGIHLVPDLRLYRKNDTELRRRVESEELLLVDTTPAIDDGKHWVVTRGGANKRIPVDAEQMAKLGLEIAPQAPPHGERRAKKLREIHVFARVAADESPASVQLTARDYGTDDTRTLIWQLAGARPADDEPIVADWVELRSWWLESAIRPSAPIGAHWLRAFARQYDMEALFRDYHPALFAANRPGGGGVVGNARRSSDMMGLLGGRAAIEETLQLQDLATDDEAGRRKREPRHPIADIPGVQVEAHPFDEMLDGAEGGRLELADWVPADHLMAYLPQPKKIYGLLGGGSDFLFRAGGGITERSLSYQLKDRYLEALGMSEELMRRFLDTGAIEEMALVVPDLFAIDGTELSVVMRTGDGLLTQAALALLGLPAGDTEKVTENARGESVYWRRRGDLLILSTSQNEIDAIVDAGTSGTGLGRSAELRYMLTQVPVTDDTVAYVYLSDPFIRHLVGPKTKINQRRRILARADLEAAIAGSLLAEFDGHGDRAHDRNFLEKRRYLPKPRQADDLDFDANGVSHSQRFGRPGRMHPLDRLPIDLVSDVEKEAYENYLADYENYWRRFFDPIALRYEHNQDDGQHQLETFILPLIDNSLYEGLRRLLTAADQPLPLQQPVLEPAPIATLSVNLNESTWLDLLENFYDSFEMFLGLDPTLLDLLGPDLHLSLQDADPIVSIGNGELQDLFGQFSGNQNDFFWIQAIASVLTRPTTIHVGLSDPDRARELLSDMSWAPSEFDEDWMTGFGSGSLYQVTGEQRWIYRYSLEGLVTLRFSFEVQDRYLVINNQPFSNPSRVTGQRAMDNSAAALHLNPAQCEAQLPALFASAVEKLRANANQGAACLMPLLATGTLDLSAATRRHRELFGFAPQHPAGGQWTWNARDGELISSLYGPSWQNQQPAFDPENDQVGLLQGVPEARIEMRFEQDGLRSRVSWRTGEE